MCVEEHARELHGLFETDGALKPGANVWNDRVQSMEAVDAPPAGVKLL